MFLSWSKMTLWSLMLHLGVLPRCSAAVEDGRCHLTKDVPETRGTLFRSMMRSVRSNLG